MKGISFDHIPPTDVVCCFLSSFPAAAILVCSGGCLFVFSSFCFVAVVYMISNRCWSKCRRHARKGRTRKKVVLVVEWNI